MTQTIQRKDLPLLVDFHAHMLEEGALKAATNKTVSTGFGATPNRELRPGAQVFFRKMLDPAAQVADMNERGIDVYAITSATVIQGSSWADPQTDLELCRRCNDKTAEWVRNYPGRFIGSFVLPLQDIKLAMQEFERAVKDLKLKLANLASNYKGAYLGEAFYQPFWEAVAQNDVTVWIHPDGIRDLWFQRYALWNSAGQSIEETKVMSSLVYDGVMEKYPGVKVVMAHGGGYFPHYMGRMDRNTLNRPDTVVNIKGKLPSDFLRSFYYDTCVYDPQVLKVLLERVGVDRLLMGSDYPVGENDPIGFLSGCGIAGDDLVKIAGGTAARLLGLPAKAKRAG
jgi:aminocarboxymuconate-semialdehyde decarboxylase